MDGESIKCCIAVKNFRKFEWVQAVQKSKRRANFYILRKISFVHA